MSNNSSEKLQNFQHILWFFGRPRLDMSQSHMVDMWKLHLQPVQNIDQIWYMAEILRGQSQDYM